MTMYDRIRDLRIKQGFTQEDLAHLLGYQDRSSIAKIEAGNVDLPQSKILAFAQVLSVSPAFLMGLENLPEPVPEPFRLTDHERKVFLAYREHPEAQPFVDKLLGVEPEPAALPKQA